MRLIRYTPLFNLVEFFGYLKVEVSCLKDIKVPVLPFKFNGKTIFPTGRWIGSYFSEELKAVLSLGYKFKFIEGYEFSKIDLFNLSNKLSDLESSILLTK